MYRYNSGGEIIEIIVRESNGAKIESYKFNVSDVNRSIRILNTVKKKYGLQDKKDKDIDWLKKKEW